MSTASSTARVTDTKLLEPLSLARPARIEYGVGKSSRLAEYVPDWSARRILVVADAFNAARADVLKLPSSHLVFPEAKPEPDLPNLERLLTVARSFDPDLIIGFGGGSAMDLAKLTAVLLESDKAFEEIVGLERADPRRCLLVALPTTAGTGSEVGTRALVLDPVSRAKLAVDSRHMVPDIALIDPILTASLPPSVTAATGIDALAHCVEAFTSRRSHPVIDLYAREGISLVGRYLNRAVADGDDVEARAGLAMAALYGGLCLGPVNTTAGHALSYPLSTRYDVPHGLANALIFPHALAFNEAAQPQKTRLVSELLGLAGNDILSESYSYCEGMGVEMRMSALGVPPDALASMATEAHGIRRLLDYNPREMSVGDIVEIYRAAF